jgi:hypothetical protein
MKRPQRVGTSWGRRLPEGLWGLKTGSAFRTLQQSDGSYSDSHIEGRRFTLAALGVVQERG